MMGLMSVGVWCGWVCDCCGGGGGIAMVVGVGFIVGLLLWQWIFVVGQVDGGGGGLLWWWEVGFTMGLRC